MRQLVRGQYMNADIDLAGIGMIVMGGLQDELFNLTLDSLKVMDSDPLIQSIHSSWILKHIFKQIVYFE